MHTSTDQLPQRICKELWALNLSLLPRPPVAEPLLHMHDGDGDGDGDGAAAEDSEERGGGEQSDEDGPRDPRDGGSGSSSSSSSSSDSDDSADGSDELDRLMRENSESPSSDDEERDDDAVKDRTAVPVKKRRRAFGIEYDVPASTVAVLVLACWTLRLPVVYMDFVRFVSVMPGAMFIR